MTFLIASWLIIGLFSSMGLLILDDMDCDPRSIRLLITGMFLGYITFLILLKDLYFVYNFWRYTR
jgi:hypothetical protein